MKLQGHKGFNFRKLAQEMGAAQAPQYHWYILMAVYTKQTSSGGPFADQGGENAPFEYTADSVTTSEVNGEGPFATPEEAENACVAFQQQISVTGDNPVQLNTVMLSLKVKERNTYDAANPPQLVQQASPLQDIMQGAF